MGGESSTSTFDFLTNFSTHSHNAASSSASARVRVRVRVLTKAAPTRLQAFIVLVQTVPSQRSGNQLS